MELLWLICMGGKPMFAIPEDNWSALVSTLCCVKPLICIAVLRINLALQCVTKHAGEPASMMSGLAVGLPNCTKSGEVWTKKTAS